MTTSNIINITDYLVTVFEPSPAEEIQPVQIIEFCGNTWNLPAMHVEDFYQLYDDAIEYGAELEEERVSIWHQPGDRLTSLVEAIKAHDAILDALEAEDERRQREYRLAPSASLYEMYG